MRGLLQWSLVLVGSGAVLAWAGTMLARAGDEVAVRTGVGGVLVGSVLVAGTTSLPEIVTGVSAAAGGNPELAVGDLFGASMANMAILAVLDLIHRRRVWPAVELGHARVASIAIGLTGLAVIGILTPEGVTFGWVGLDSILIAAAAVAGVAWMRRSRPRVLPGAPPPPPGAGGLSPLGLESGEGDTGLKPAGVRFAVAALVVFASGPLVARAGAEVAQEAGLGQTFVGAALIAVATTLPELVTGLAAVRIGAHDLAVGNLFGSNAWNMSVLLPVDIAYRQGPVLTGLAGPAEAVAGVAAILMMAAALAAIVHGQETRIGRLEPDALLLLALYPAGLAAVWAASS